MMRPSRVEYIPFGRSLFPALETPHASLRDVRSTSTEYAGLNVIRD